MKKFFMFAAMASVAFASCVKNETAPVAISAEQEIVFESPVLLPNVKSTNEIQNNFPTDVNIGVWAHFFDNDDDEYTNFAAGQLYMGKDTYGLEIQYFADATVDNPNNTTAEVGTWKHATNKYYWPKNGSLTFSAYAPCTAKTKDAASVGATGILFEDYVVDHETNSNQEDLLFSERVYNKKAVDNNTTYPYAGVALDFKHALSSIVFKVKAQADYSTTQLTVKKIELLNVVNKGSFNQGLDDEDGAVTDGPETQLWTLATAAENKKIYSVDLPAGGIILDETNVKYTHNGETDATAPVAGKRVTDLILLPQELDNCQLRVTFELLNDQMDQNRPLTQVLVKDLATTTVDEWLRGSRYTYTISVALDEIYFEPTVTDWDDVDPALPDFEEYQ